MATMKQVADLAEVSIATVSRVINKTGYVSPELADRVREAMESLHYQPSSLARGLRRQESQTIGVLVPQLDHPFFSRLCFAIEKALFVNEYRTFMCSAEEDRDKESSYVEMLLRQRVDGVIMVPTGHSIENVQALLSKIPVIIVDRDVPEINTTKVMSDNVHGGYIGTEHLIGLGHRHIGVIGGPGYSEPIMQRIQGIRKALADYQLSLPESLVYVGEAGQFENGYSATKVLLAQDPRPTALFALTDVMAMGVMHAAAEMKLSVPDDLSIMGFDDIPLASYCTPTLSSVAQPIYEMGEVAAKKLLQHIRQPSDFVQILLKTRLQIRQSTAPPCT